MAEEVIINDLSTAEVSYIVHELKMQGLVINQDFDFFFHPPQTPKWDDETNKFVRKHTRFVFYKDSWATWFVLKYGR